MHWCSAPASPRFEGNVNTPSGAVDVPCSLFGGVDTEMAPMDLPEGVSPDCQDVIFLPGSVSSRPGMHKIFPHGNGGFGLHYNVNYQKSFVTNTGNTLNLFLTGEGQIWQEDVDNSPGILTNIGFGGYGSYAVSATALGREFIAFSDGVHGAFCPLQYDGTNV